MMAIEMVGGVYCPLSSRDPQHRLDTLAQQTQARLVLVHHLTATKFNHNIVLLNTDSAWANNNVNNDTCVQLLSSVMTVPDDIAYVIFTSGSTGTPKPARLRHRNFTRSIQSLLQLDIFNEKDTVLQIARCSFDIHVQEILGTLIIGGTLAMLHPRGNLDFEYLSRILQSKQITFLYTVPTLLNLIFSYITNTHKSKAVKYLRSLCTGGERCSTKLIQILANNLNIASHIWNLCGPAETTLQSIFHLVNLQADKNGIPLGRPLPNYHCIIHNDFGQHTTEGQEGELMMGGVGIFAGYLERDDLTAKALIDIDGELFYRTGDLVRMDENGLIHYIGRKDHQVKLRGQRIELGEIERCLLNISTISTCVVIKYNDDHLIAYVQSSSHLIEEQQLRQHCQSHLPPHMIPSFFIILEQLPLNANGKIDRKLLPSPDYFTHLSSSLHHMIDNSNNEFLQPVNDIQQIIHDMWCDMLHQKQISINTSLFTIGGHSLFVMQLFHRYKIDFHLESTSLSISYFFQYPTIKEHAHLIHQTLNINIEDVDHHQWSSLHVFQARASYAQERIFLDEHIRFSLASTNTNHRTYHHNIYGIPLLYRLSSSHSHLSISRLRHAFHSLIIKHNILRTALYLDDVDGSIVQECFDKSLIMNEMISCRFTVVNLHNNSDNDGDQYEIVQDLLHQSDLFDLSKGHIINCHLLHHHHHHHESSTDDDDDLLSENDWILFTVHHAAFDGASTAIFLRDLALAYDQDENVSLTDDSSLQYMDYSVHEHCMDMTVSRQFWHDQLQGYDLQSRLSLPVDRHRISVDQRSGLASSIEITFDDEICTTFLHYASSHHLTLFQLGLATFYAFLFRLTHGQTDLCVASINANRYRNELVNMIGMFVSTLPYRLHIADHQWSFDELVEHVREKCLSILEHSHYPLQEIFSHFHVNQSNVGFLETMFHLINVSSEQTQLSLDGTNLEQVSLNESYQIAKFDIMFTLVYDQTCHGDRLLCNFVCSHDLFDQTNVTVLSQRLTHFYRQLFLSDHNDCRMESWSLPLYNLVIILPEEAREIEDIVFCPQLHVLDEGMCDFSMNIISVCSCISEKI